MHIRFKLPALAALALGAAAITPAAAQDAANMSFFVTSVGLGNGADLGGLEGADAHCQQLAGAAGSTGKTWRAYLSTVGTNGGPGINARDRIGSGPWVNAKGVTIAANVEELHSAANKINKETALSEKGGVIPGRGDTLNEHDMLTGSNQDGTVVAGDAANATCGNWTSSGEGSAMLGHTDLQGNPSGINFWNNSHGSRGCSQENLVSTGGAGLYYCFAAN